MRRLQSTILATALAVAFAAGDAAAQEGASFDPQALQMMPGLTQQQKNKLRRAMQPVLNEIQGLRRRIQNMEKRIREVRGREGGRDAQKLRRGIYHARGLIPLLYWEAEQRLKEAGLNQAQMDRLRRMPRGQLAQYRYGHSTVLEVAGLNAAQKALLERMVAATDAAQGYARAQSARLGEAAKEKDLSKEVRDERRRMVQDFERRIREMDQRFWWAADIVLTDEQRQEMRKLLPPRYQPYNNFRSHVYALPGLTPSQATRINALFEQQASESTADRAETQRLQKEMRNKGLNRAQRQRIQQQLAAAYRRLQELNQGFREDLRKVLNERQLLSIRSVPPVLNAQDRTRRPVGLYEAARMEQQDKIRELGRTAQQEVRKVRQASQAKLSKMQKEFGADSPQAMEMQMMRAGMNSQANEIQRGARKKALLEVLEPAQVAHWIVTLRGR